MHLIDSDVAIDAMAARIEALAALEAAATFGLRTSIISVGELYDGVSRRRDPQRRHDQVANFLRSFEIVDLNQATMIRFGRIRANLRDTGQLIGDFDIVIAATAIENDLVLITRNRSHFERIPELRFLTPDEVLKG
jgi:tRNA(fMet)-specific endonuclease VapC